MKILLMSAGTRGDMEPFLAIGEMFKKRGHTAVCAFPEQFRNLVERSGLGFASLGPEIIDVMETAAVKNAAGSGLGKFIAFVQAVHTSRNIFDREREIVKNEKPDRILYNTLAVYPVLWELENKGKSIFIIPLPYMHYVKNHTHVIFHSNFGNFLNRLTYSIANSGLITAAYNSAKWLKPAGKISRRQMKNIISTRKAIYTLSPAIFPRPAYWPDHVQVLGYHERDKAAQWEGDDNLEKFIGAHEKMLLVTFGSMMNPVPERITQVILETLEKNKIPAVLNTASGGLAKPKNYNAGLFYFMPEVPYNWVFPKVYAVIHHGGAGTTQMALKYGCPSMIIPHILDQYSWGSLVHDLGAGPKGLPIYKLSKKTFEKQVIDLLENQSYKTKALEIAGKMKSEDYKGMLYNAIINL